MKHKIEVSYLTGDSFSNEDRTSILELEWDNLDIAKENLKAIREHYKLYDEVENRSWNEKRSVQEIITKYADNDWFVGDLLDGEYDTYLSTYCIKLKADNGNYMQMTCFWCGYFETLYGADIISEDSDLSFKL